jgi:predicted chitinase
MASKSKQYFNNIGTNKKNTISLLVNVCKEKGITNPITQAAICAIVSKESDFVPKGESSYANTSVSRIRSIFGKKLNNYTDAQIDVLKKDEKQFFSIVYGDSYGNGPPSTKDGWIFRGRGFNQLTFRDNYRTIGKSINHDLENNPELMERLDVAAKALVQYYINSFSKMSSSMLNQYGVNKQGDSISTMNGIKDIASAVRVLYQATAGANKTKNGLPIGLYLEKGASIQGDGDIFFPNDDLGGFTKARNRAPLFYKLITGGDLPKDPIDTDKPISDIIKDDITNNDLTSQVVFMEFTDSEGRNTELYNNNDNEVEVVIPGLTNIFPPTIKVEPIRFNAYDESFKFKKEVSSKIGWMPFIWYNSYQIKESDISYFALYNDGLMPCVTIIFNDTMNMMRDKAFPLDDTKIKIFLSSRTKKIRHIFLEFKIKNFSINGNSYTIIGTLNVNGLHVQNYKSYSQKTSYYALQDICKEVGLGFNSNISDTDDKMTWINTGLKVHDFINEIMLNSYINDEGFPYGYIDFYYNFNYVDIEKEISRDNTEDKGIDTSGLSSDITGDDERIYTMALTNDKSAKDTDRYISSYRILNNSTSVSLNRGYLNICKFYDSIKKEFLIFDVDSITSEGDKTIIMKGSPQDEEFYRQNYTSTYVGKMDIDNVHKNFNYSDVHNTQNLEDLQKIGIILTLKNPNYNLYRFQKVTLLITNLSGTPANDIKNDRISGDWFIVDIKFIFDNNGMRQEVSLIKRELELSPDELEAQEALNAEQNQGNNSSNWNNPIENTTNPSDITDTDVFSDTSSNFSRYTIPPPPPGKYDLEYIIGPEDKLSKLKDNSGNYRKLVVVDGQVVDETVANAFLQMREDAAKEGVKISISSGFRPAFGPNFTAKTSKNKNIDITTQESLRRDKSRWIMSVRNNGKYRNDDDFVMNAPASAYNPATAPPGKSNHGNGFALDLSTGSRVSFSKKLNDKVYTWLVKNSWKYGFVRSVNSEEWHYEYRPKESKQGPYAIVKPVGNNKNLYYSDLGLDNIKIT